MQAHRRHDMRSDLATLALVIVIGALVYGWVASGATTMTGFSDSMDYVFMADFYREWLHGTPSATAEAYYRATRFPPLFPMLLAAAGAGSNDLHLANGVSCATAVVAAVAVWCWLRIEAGRRLATIAAVALLLYPGFFLLNLTAASEPLGIAFLCAALALLAGPEPTRNRVAVAALVIGLSPLVRIALLPLVAAFVLWLWIGRRFPKATLLALSACAVAPVAAWFAYRRLLGAESYTASLDPSMLLRAWGGWPEALWLQPARMFTQFIENWGVAPTLLTTLASLVLATLALAGGVIRLKQGKLDAMFLAGYVAMILVWPFPDHFWRFLILAYPLILLSASTALHRIAERQVGERIRPFLRTLPAAVVLLVACATLPTAARYTHRAGLPIDPALVGEKRVRSFFWPATDQEALAAAELYGRIRFAAKAMKPIVGNRCVYSVFPQSLALHGGINAIPYPAGLDPDRSAERSLAQCEYYFLSGFNETEDPRLALFPRRALEGWTEPVLVSRFALPNGRTLTAAALARRKASK